MRNERIKTAAGRLLDVLYPPGSKCLACGDPRRASPQDGLCPACRKALREERVPASGCSRCLTYVPPGGVCPLCRQNTMPDVERVYAPFRYLPRSRALVTGLKFRGTDEALPLLADTMAGALTDRDFDVMIPVPLHPKRLAGRGVNQAALLAQAVSLRTGIPVAEPLQRVRDTRPQSGLVRARRRENVADAFQMLPGAEVHGKRCLLVDDVRTTGHTAQACAGVLRGAGAASVRLLCACVVWRFKGE